MTTYTANPGDNLQTKASVLVAGDTLVLNNGTYSTSPGLNVSGINGTAGAPITIKAANDGQVLINGGGTFIPFFITNASYITVQGLRLQNSSESVAYLFGAPLGGGNGPIDHITLQRITAHGAANQNWHVFAVNGGGSTSPAVVTNILLEDCAAWGPGRYMFSTFHSDTVIFRRCFAYWNTITDTLNEPRATFNIYGTKNGTLENCIGVHCIPYQTETFNNWFSASWMTSDDTVNAPTDNLIMRGCAFYNNWDGYIHVSSTGTGAQFIDCYFESPANAATWTTFAKGVACSIDTATSGNTIVIDRCTFRASPLGLSYTSGTLTLKNSSFNGNTTGMDTNLTHTNCGFFGNGANGTTTGGTDKTSDPLYDTATYGRGGAMFVPAASPYKGAGSGGSDIGANILYQYVNGTLTANPLWPWPMEARIVAELGQSPTYSPTSGPWLTLSGLYSPSPPTTTTLASDTFAARTVAGSLGTASDGHVWTHDSGFSTPSVGSNEGRMTGNSTAGNSFLLGSVTSARQNVSVRGKYSGAGDMVGVMGRRTAANTFYRAILRAGNFEIRLHHTGTVTLLAGQVTTALSPNPFTVAANTFYWIRFDLNGTALQAKVWPDGNTEPASYQLSVTNSVITAAGGFGIWGLVNPITDAVTFDSFTATDGTSISPLLAASPTALSFSALVGGSSPATQNDTLAETAGVSTPWTSAISYAAGGSGWLGIAASSGSLTALGTATIVYTCTTGALGVGTYTATVTYTATTGGATASVAVTFVVNATTAVLSTSPSTLAFSAMVGGASPAPQSDVLSNVGGTTSAWTSAIAYGSGSGWLGIAASSGSLASGATATIVYTCTTGALAIGTYTATVTYTATTGGSTATVLVTFTVTSAAMTYALYKTVIEPNMVAALASRNLTAQVQLIGPDTSTTADDWVTNATGDLASTLAGYARHTFPAGSADIASDSVEMAALSLVSTTRSNDPSSTPIFQTEMAFAGQGPGASVTLYQYGVEMADFAVQLARAGLSYLVAYLADDDMHGVAWGLWQSSTDQGTPRPWYFPWFLLCNFLPDGSILYAPAQPPSNDFRVLAAQVPGGAWTFVLVSRRPTAQTVQVIVPFAPAVSSQLSVYTYSEQIPLAVDTNGFPLSSGTLSVVLQRGFTMPIAANSVLVLTGMTPGVSPPPTTVALTVAIMGMGVLTGTLDVTTGVVGQLTVTIGGHGRLIVTVTAPPGPPPPGLPPPPPIGPVTITVTAVKRPPLPKRS